MQTFLVFLDFCWRRQIFKLFESFCNFWVIFNFFRGIYKNLISNLLVIFLSCAYVLVTKQVCWQAPIAQMERIIGLCCLLFVRSIQMYQKFFVRFEISFDLKTFQTSGKRTMKRPLNCQDSKLCQSCENNCWSMCHHVHHVRFSLFQLTMISLL